MLGGSSCSSYWIVSESCVAHAIIIIIYIITFVIIISFLSLKFFIVLNECRVNGLLDKKKMRFFMNRNIILYSFQVVHYVYQQLDFS